MGSSGGGGGGSSYDDAPQRYQAKKSRQKAEEQALGNDAYVKSSTGNIVRSSSGRGVTTGKGQKAKEEYREKLFEKSDLSTYDEFGNVVASERGRDVARMQLEYRQKKDPIALLGKGLPFGMGSALMGVGSMNRKQQLANLAARGQPQFRYSSSGRFVVGGVTPAGQRSEGGNVIDSFAQSDNGGSMGENPQSATSPSKPSPTPSAPTTGPSSATRRLLASERAAGVKRRMLIGRPSV
jgi:hypothetical protein